jgi:hypothetical protein
VIPFQPLLARDLADQTTIAQALAPASPADPQPGTGQASAKADQDPDEPKPASKDQVAATTPPSVGSDREDLEPLIEMQQRTLRRTQLLKLKAEAELTRVEKEQPKDAEKKVLEPSSGKNDPAAAGAAAPKPIDPKELKAGYQKAIGLAPRAVEQMERALKLLKAKDSPAAYPRAEEARKILEEIQKSQPKEVQQDQKQQQDDKKNDDKQKQDQKDQQKDDQQKKDQQKKDEKQKEEEKKKQEDSKNSGEQKQEQKQQEPQVSRDRIEEALRKVRERQQEKRDRDRAMKVRAFGRAPVEKDW